jgi:O-antigen/teichoic acid export membrane protein
VIGLRGIARNAALNFAGQAIPLLIGAATIPFTIRWLGGDRFGVLSLVWVVTGYFTVFDLGLGRATTKFVAQSIAEDPDRVPILVGTSLAAQAVLGILGGVAIAFGAGPLLEQALSLPPDLAGEAHRSFALLAVGVPFVLVSASLRGTLEAAQRFGLVNSIRMPLNSMYFVVPFVGAWAGWSLPWIVLGIVSLFVFATMASWALCVHVFPAVRRPRFEWQVLRLLVAFGGWVAVSSVVGPVLIYLDRFVIAAMLSIAAAGRYAAPYELVTRLWIIPVSLVTVLFPLFSASGRTPQLIQSLAVRSLRLLLFMMGSLMLITILLADELMRLLLGAELGAPMVAPLRILAVGLFVNSLAFVPYTMLQARGRPDVTGRLHLAELPLHVALTLGLVGAFGLVGAALAWSIRVVVDAGLLFAMASRLDSIPYRSLRTSGTLGLAVAALVMMALAIAFAAVGTPVIRMGLVVLTVAGAALVSLRAGIRDRLVGGIPAEASKA